MKRKTKITVGILLLILILPVLFLFLPISPLSVLSEPPHIVHEKRMPAQSASLTFDQIKNLEEVYKVRFEILAFGGWNEDSKMNVFLNQDKVKKIRTDHKDNHDWNCRGSCPKDFVHWEEAYHSFNVEVSDLDSKTISYEIEDLYPPGDWGNNDFRSAVETGSRCCGNLRTIYSKIKVYEEVECTKDSHCVGDRICEDNLCLEPDSDNDNVVDSKDDCPNTYGETFNGCPVESPEPQKPVWQGIIDSMVNWFKNIGLWR